MWISNKKSAWIFMFKVIHIPSTDKFRVFLVCVGSCVMLSESITLLSLVEDAIWLKDMCTYTRLTKGHFQLL